MDDLAVGAVLRTLRRRRGWRQEDLAARAGCSQAQVSRIEAGHLEETTLRQLRLLFSAVEARIEPTVRWRGADLERLLDEAHAAVVAEIVRRLEMAGWIVAVELTYSEYGERGAIDVLAMQADLRAALVVEVKTELASMELIARKLDEKVRLAPGIVHRRFGWRPTIVGRVLVVPDSSKLRRRLVDGTALRRALPAGGRAVRAWLRDPAFAIAGVWFLSNIAPRNAKRVRRVRTRASQAGNDPGTLATS